MSNDGKTMPMTFEKPIAQVEERIEELLKLMSDGTVDFTQEIETLQGQAGEIRKKLYASLSPAQKLQVARHPQRPNFLEIVQLMSPECWIELHGDRAGADDRAIIGGIIKLPLTGAVMVVGTQKGRGMKENLTYNFGMANPEGYRKALRLFQHAEKFKMPILTLIDTPGAYPGIASEEKGIGQAIALNIREMARLKVPVVSVVTGEGASGGALGIGVANRIYMMEHSLYTVISPEGCASILWRSAEQSELAAEALKITAPHLLAMGLADAIIPEPEGGGHRDPKLFVNAILETVESAFQVLKTQTPEALTSQRYSKFRSIGAFSTLAR
jgi:acetyl-CoA carboxylase carboxyl transferase subunit alpha